MREAAGNFNKSACMTLALLAGRFLLGNLLSIRTGIFTSAGA